MMNDECEARGILTVVSEARGAPRGRSRAAESEGGVGEASLFWSVQTRRMCMGQGLAFQK